MFCPVCVRRGSEVQIGDNKTRITCFQQDCGADIDFQVLKKVLRPCIYEKLVEKKQLEDVSKAGLKNLVQCNSCNYAVILPDSEKLFTCGNPECGKSICRLCGEDSHLPLRCEEVEKADEITSRTKLENAMSEAMIRECPKCKNRFFKTDGCNLMHCTCGATMCYLCRNLVPDNYKHFYGQGAEPAPGLCPLFSDNESLHKSEVMKAATLGKKNMKGALKYDPTKDMAAPPRGFDPKKVAGVPNNYDDESDDDEEEDYDSEDEYDTDDEDGFDPFQALVNEVEEEILLESSDEDY